MGRGLLRGQGTWGRGNRGLGHRGPGTWGYREVRTCGRGDAGRGDVGMRRRISEMGEHPQES